MRNALNEVLRTEYIKDCQRGVDRWNKTIKDEGISFELRLPSNKFQHHPHRRRSCVRGRRRCRRRPLLEHHAARDLVGGR